MSFYFRMRFSWYITSRCQFYQVFCFFVHSHSPWCQTASRLMKYHCSVANALHWLSSKTIGQASFLSGIWNGGLYHTLSLENSRWIIQQPRVYPYNAWHLFLGLFFAYAQAILNQGGWSMGVGKNNVAQFFSWSKSQTWLWTWSKCQDVH